MGCESSRHSLPVNGNERVSGCAGIADTERATSAHHHLINVVTDRDVHDAYDFTGPVLGKGSFATVLRVRDTISGSEFAIKQIDLGAVKDSPSAQQMIERECRTMMALSHPNIVRLQEVYRPPSGDKIFMVLDRLEGGSVDGLWRKQGSLSEDHAAHIILQVVSAVRYCHDRGIAHRDLKMENSLYEDSSLVPIIKVIDFGLCAEMKDGVSSRAFVGTILYTAPEILKVDGHGLACDLWSIGVMAYALVSGQFPWYSESRDVCGQMIKYTPLRFPTEDWEGVSPLCRDFIEKCLVKKPKKRMTAKQAQRHPWLQRAARLMNSGAPLSKESMMAMLDYQNGNAFKKIVMELVAYSYEPTHIKDLELDFLRMDKQGKGEIRLQDFKDGLLERWAVMNEGARPVDAGSDGGHDGTCTGTQDRLPLKNGGAAEKAPGRSRDRDETQSNASTATTHDSSGALAAYDPGGMPRGELPNKSVCLGGKRARTTENGHGLFAPRVTAEQAEGRPDLSGGGGGGGGSDAARGAGVDAELLNAALEALLADSRVSREGLNRMLNARQRRPLSEEDSRVDAGTLARGGGTALGADGDVADGRDSRGSSPGGDRRHRIPAKMDERWAEEIFNAMDHDHSGSITFTDFVAGCLVDKQVGETALRTAFTRLDHSRSGLISLEDVRMYLGEDFREEELVRNMRAISSRFDGQVSYDDFKKCLLGGALPNSRVVTPAMSRSASFKALSRLASSTQLADTGEDSKDLEAEERSVLKAAALASASATSMLGTCVIPG